MRARFVSISVRVMAGSVAMRYRRHIPREVRRYHLRRDIDVEADQLRENLTVQ
jgi:hypothetical protein